MDNIMEIALNWHCTEVGDVPEKTGEYLVITATNYVGCLMYSTKHGKWNVKDSDESFEYEIQDVCWWTDIRDTMDDLYQRRIDIKKCPHCGQSTFNVIHVGSKPVGCTRCMDVLLKFDPCDKCHVVDCYGCHVHDNIADAKL